VERRKAQSLDLMLTAALRAISRQDPAQVAPLLLRAVAGQQTRAFVGPEVDKLNAAESASGLFSAALAALADQARLARKSVRTPSATGLLSTICDVNSRSTEQRLTDAQLMSLLQCSAHRARSALTTSCLCKMDSNGQSSKSLS
jgi:hypothetical protein